MKFLIHSQTSQRYRWNLGLDKYYYPTLSWTCNYLSVLHINNLLLKPIKSHYPDSKVHGANMGPTWVLSAPDGSHVGPMNLAIRITIQLVFWKCDIIVGSWYVKLRRQGGVESGYPRPISSDWPSLPADLDAAVYWPSYENTWINCPEPGGWCLVTLTGVTIFFKVKHWKPSVVMMCGAWLSLMVPEAVFMITPAPPEMTKLASIRLRFHWIDGVECMKHYR